MGTCTLLLSLAALAFGCVEGVYVSWRSPYWMNEAGGMTLELRGSGFSSDQFNQFNATKGNKVTLVNEVDSITCEVINYLTTPTKIVCTTGPRGNTNGPDIYKIEVVSDGVKATRAHYVQFAWWLAPKIQTVTPHFAAPLTVVKFWGWLHTNQFDKLDVADPDNSPTSSTRITRVFMGGVECEMYDSNDELYGTLTSHQLYCRPLTIFIGAMNSSVYVTNRGPSVTDKWGLYVDSRDRLYQHHTYTVVYNVTPSVSSSKGGALINITGMGFLGKTKVEVGGAECEVQKVSYNSLTCLTPQQDHTKAGSGSMGLLFELWEGISFGDLRDEASWESLNNSHPNYTSSVTIDMEYQMEISQDSVGKFRGYLHVAHDGLYSLEPHVANYHVLFLATDGNISNIRYYHYKEKFLMSKDTPAYFEIRFRAYDTFLFRLVMHDFNAKYTYAQARYGVDARQKVSLNPKEVYETLMITVNGDGGMAKLYLNGFSSDAVNVSSVDEVRNGLMDLTEQKCHLNGDTPKFNKNTGFEEEDEELPGAAGRYTSVVPPFCGRRVRQARSSDPRIYQNDVKGEMDANTYPYLCFALLGNTQDDMSVRFAWHDGRRNRVDTITFKHGQSYSSDRWTYHCYSLIQIANESWISHHGYQEGKKLEVYRVWVAKPKGLYDRVYVDEFTFSSEDITVVQTRPSALKSAGGILVANVEATQGSTTENSTSYEIKYITANCLSGFPLLGIYATAPDSSWPGSLASATNKTFNLGAGGHATVVKTAVATSRMGGTWDLHIQGRVLRDIPPYVSKERLEVMLDTVMGTSNGFDVSESLNCGYNNWYIKWLRDPGMKDLIYSDISKLTFDGEKVNNYSSHEDEGRVFHYPITPDFVTAYTYTPKVAVWVNGYPAACEGKCDLSYDDNGAPSLISVSGIPDSSGTYSMTMSGSGFTAAEIIAYTVKLGDKNCAVTSVTGGQILCTVQLSAKVYSVSLAMQPIGSALNTLTYDVPLTVTAINPTTGGTGGGYQVTISGKGFAETNEMEGEDGVTIGGKECKIVTSAYGELKCIAPPGPAGPADVVVKFGGKTVTNANNFTYDASLSATITSAAPSTLSVLGGQEITITGSNLGSSGSIKIGEVECEVTSWSTTSITCTSPSLPPATYPVTATTSHGYASGSVTVTYTFSLISSSPPQGSTKGGSFMTLHGQGFGSNCSLLHVRLGENDGCEITECSDTSITCQVQLVPKSHLVTNKGNDSAVGVSWMPAVLDIYEGDSVVWQWSPKFPTSQLTHNIFQTATPTDDKYDGSGFYSGSPVASGSIQQTFHHKATVYYASQPINDAVVLRGQINVRAPEQKAYKVTLTLSGIEASYDPDGSNATVTVSGCSPLVTSPLDSCNVTAPTPVNATHLYFTSSTCFTPRLTGVTAAVTESIPGLRGIQVRSGSSLTLSGSGFGTSACQNLVTLGDATCSITSAAADQLTCDLDDLSQIISTKPFPIRIIVLNRGEAQVDIANYTSEGQVTLVPVVTSFSPREGSVHGGTRVTISGSGLKDDSGTATVSLGGTGCEVETITATSIICVTRPRIESSVTLAVVVGQVSAIMDLPDNTYNYTLASTPTISSVTSTGSSITVTGSNYGSDTYKVLVVLTLKTPERRLREGKVVEEDLENKLEADGDEEKYFDDVAADDDISVGVKEEEELIVEEKEDISEKDKEYMKEMGDSEAPVRLKRPRVHAIHTHLFDEGSSFWGRFTKTEARSFDDTLKLGMWKIGGSGMKIEAQRKSFAEERSKRLRKRAAEEESKRMRKGTYKEEGESRTAEDDTITCIPTSVTDTEIKCNAPDISAGTYNVKVNIIGSGNSESSQLTASSQITSVDPAEGSTNGGAVITITGSAFAPTNVAVGIGDIDCQVLNVTTTSITCRTEPHAAAELLVKVMSGGSQATSPVNYTYTDAKTPNLTSVSPSPTTTGGSLTLSGSNLIPSGADPEVLVDGITCTLTSTASPTSLSCTAPDLMGGEHSVVVRDTIYGKSNTLTLIYTLSLTSVSPTTAGFGGAEVMISGTGFDPAGTSTVTICGTPCSPITSSSSSQLQCVVPPKSANGSSTIACDVIVRNPDGSNVTLSSGFTYDDSLTTTVTAITPKRGGTAGGTTITITGTGFASSGNSVKIGESVCVIKTENSTTITCTTEAHQGPGYFPVLVSVPAKGIATTDENGIFFYIDRWSSVYTWGGEAPPSTGQLVVIEKNQTILLDQSTDVLKMLLIKGGHVVFDEEATSELVLRAEYILILEGGSLNIGSEDKPFQGPAVIELHGNTKSLELPHYGAKVLAVREGSLELHGAHIPITWTHLATTASPGDTTITLKLPVTWKAGDKIVIATTEFRFMKNQNEVREIASVSSDKKTLSLKEALQYEHISIEQTIGGRTIETRAEVGLLSRNVKIRGAINADFSKTIEGCDEKWRPGQFATQSCFNGRFGSEEGSDQFGATVMLFGKRKNENLVQGKIEYIEVTEAGQAFQLGRYPLHFHLVGNVSTSYIRGCAVYKTYNRALTIHAADHLLVEYNVVYNNMGHAIFTEDGIEQHNIIQYNLAIYTRTSSSLLNVDITPSSYWIVNPNNIVQHNAAAGGTHFGYWYRLERNPSGPSATSTYCQNNAPMGTFINNTAHSYGRYGLWVFSMDGYFPKTRTCSGSNEVAEWHNFTVWRCDRGAEVVFGGALQFHNFVTLDNQHAGLEMVKVIGGFGQDDGPGVFNSLVIGYSSLSPDGCRSETSGIIAPKQEIFSILDTKFVNFDNRTCSALSGCSQCKERQGGFRAQVKGLSFENSPNKVKFKWEHETIWIDTDGSLTGTAENRVVPSMGILPTGNCQEKDAFSVNPQVKGSVCSNLKFMRFIVKGPNIEPQSLQGKNLIMSNTHGNTSVPYRIKRLSTEGWMGILFTKDTYKWQFENSEQITNITYSAATSFIDTGDYYYVQHTFLQRPDGFGTVDEERNSSTSLPDPSAGGVHGDYYWDNATNTMTYLVAKNTARRSTFDDRLTGSTRKIEFRVYRCKYIGCIPPTVPPVPTGRPNNTYRWSDKETWKEVPVGSGGHPNESYYGLPVEGDKIIVPAGMWLLVDIETPSLGRVYVYGTIEFEDTMDHVFNTTIIFIQGGTLAAGFSDLDPFTHNLNIILRGSLDPTDPDNTDMPMPAGTPSLGWKAIGAFGNLKLHSVVSGKTWVKLGATAAAGATTLTLAESVDASWLNSQVVITTTSKETLETEVRIVTAVSGTSITLDSPLTYEHIAASHSLTGLSDAVVLAGEVGLLTRKIVVEGNTYPGFEKKLGGRVLVSKLTQDGIEYKGSAQLSGVEFRNMGQLGFDDSDDPRFSLTFHSLGTNTGNSSYVSKCSFNTNYNTALGFFGSGSISVEDNVIYHTVGGSIVDESEGNIYKRNLVSNMLFPGTFNGAEEIQNLDWYGAFHLNNAKDTVLEGNVVAGSQQAGVRTYGEDCSSTSLWTDNEIHSAIFGVLLWKKSGSGSGECKRISNTYAWRIEDTAFYMQHYASLVLSDVVSVDNNLGTNQLVYQPAALSHVYEAKTATVKDSLFVGATPSHTCALHQSSSVLLNFLGQDKFWEGAPENGTTAILFSSFTSGVNMAPKHKFNEAATYPALGGAHYIQDVTFSSFTTRSCRKDIALMTNKDSDDAIHPIFTTGLTFLDTPEDNRVFIHRANLGRVNPSDCVDMDCDGLKKVVVQDTDGSLLGSANATLTSQAEHEWDGDRSRGVGDYRIPVALRQNLDGSEISAASKFPNKGIVRNSGCVNMTVWQGWKCTGLAHRMLTIESMDSDTEIRRLSPIGLIANPGSSGYVDLLNGPMDRGWCFGYTCQERISTFYAVVATQHDYEMAMTSTPPQHLRLRILHCDPSESILLRIFFPKTQRFNVYKNQTYVPPTNIDNTKSNYQLHPEDPKYEPKLSDASGTNYLQRSKKLLHVVIRGSEEIDIIMEPMIILSTGVVVDPDNFFEGNVVQNLADLLGVSSSNIRLVKVVREGSGSRKVEKTTETVQMEFEVGSPPTSTLNGSSPATGGNLLSREDLNASQARLVTAFQTGAADGVTSNLTIANLDIEEFIPPPEEPGAKATKEEGSVVTNGELYSNKKQKEEEAALNKSLQAVTYDQPSGATLRQSVKGKVITYTLFNPYPSISVEDANGNIVENLGHLSNPWQFTATLIGGPRGGRLMGIDTVPYKDGLANFTDLFVDLPGRGYKLSFSVTHPNTTKPLIVSMKNKFRAVRKKVGQKMNLHLPEETLITNQPFSLNLQLYDWSTGDPVDDIALMNQTMSISLSLFSRNRAMLEGDTKLTVTGKNMTNVTMDGLSVDKEGQSYWIKAVSDVQPAGWRVNIKSPPFNVRVNESEPTNITLIARIMARMWKLKRYKEEYAKNLLAKLKDEVGIVTWRSVTVREFGKKADIQATGTIGSVRDATSELCELVSSKKGFAAEYKDDKKFRIKWVKPSDMKRPSRNCRWKK